MVIKSCKYSSNNRHNKSTKVKVMNGRSQSLSHPILLYILFKYHEMFVINFFQGITGVVISNNM